MSIVGTFFYSYSHTTIRERAQAKVMLREYETKRPEATAQMICPDMPTEVSREGNPPDGPTGQRP